MVTLANTQWRLRKKESRGVEILVDGVPYRSLPDHKRYQLIAQKAEEFRLRFGVTTPSNSELKWREMGHGK